MRKIVMLAAGLLAPGLLAGCQARLVPPQAAAQLAAPAALPVADAGAALREMRGPMPGLPGIGDKFSGAVPVYGRAFPLPPGLWTVADSRALAHQHVGPLTGDVMLVQARDGVLRGIVSVGTNVNAVDQETKLNTVCTASDVLLNDMRGGGDLGNQDCLAVNYYRLVVARQTPAEPLGSTLQVLDQMGVRTPNFVVGFMLYESGAAGRLHEEWLINPDLHGVAPDTATLRARSAWASYAYGRDPAKRGLIAELKAEGDRVRGALRHELSARPAIAGGALTQI